MGTDTPEALADILPLTPAVLHILLALAEGPRHGYRLMKDIARMSEGFVSLGPGSLYGSIERMTELGLIEPTEDPDANGEPSRRRYFRITRTGRQTLLAESARLDNVLSHIRRIGVEAAGNDL